MNTFIWTHLGLGLIKNNGNEGTWVGLRVRAQNWTAGADAKAKKSCWSALHSDGTAEPINAGIKYLNTPPELSWAEDMYLARALGTKQLFKINTNTCRVD